MSLYWYACISTNTYYFEIHHISLEMDQWALSNASSIVQICIAICEILADEAFTVTDSLISQSFVAAFIQPTYVQIALIWGFPAQLSLWKSVHWLWRYKLNEVCNTKLEEFLTRLQKSWEEATKLIEEAIWSEKKKSSEIKDWRQCMARE